MSDAVDGSVARALLWVLAGLLVLVTLTVLVAPELASAPGAIGELLLLVLAAGLPGLILIALLVRRRRRLDDLES